MLSGTRRHGAFVLGTMYKKRVDENSEILLRWEYVSHISFDCEKFQSSSSTTTPSFAKLPLPSSSLSPPVHFLLLVCQQMCHRYQCCLAGPPASFLLALPAAFTTIASTVVGIWLHYCPLAQTEGRLPFPQFQQKDRNQIKAPN